MLPVPQDAWARAGMLRLRAALRFRVVSDVTTKLVINI